MNKSFHGIFDEVDDIVGLMDDGIKKVNSGSSDVISDITTNGNRAILIDMNTRIGTLGGNQGNGQPINALLIVLEAGTNSIITAYPKIP